jgi:hypothetical protein
MSDTSSRRPESSILGFGFRLLSFSHIYSPFFPLVPYYQLLYGYSRTAIVDADDLVVEVYIRPGRGGCLWVVNRVDIYPIRD